MAFELKSGDQDELMMEINTTPLIDVMLVLLVMLIITIPIQTHAVKLNMPTTPPKVPHVPTVVTIDINSSGEIRWNGELMDDPQLTTRFTNIARQSDQDEIHIHPSRKVAYASVAHVLAIAQRLGANKLGMTGNEEFLNN
jgi:biopolymer transport protein ExbD